MDKIGDWRNTKKAWGPLFLAVVFTVAYKLGDGYVMNQMIVSDNDLISTMVYLTIGAGVGLIINYILCQTPLGRLVDNSFQSIRGMSAKAHKVAAISGILSALTTGIYLWSFSTLDPSLVVPLTSLSIVYIAVVESIKGRLRFGYVLPSIALVAIGVGIAFYKSDADWAVTGETLVVLLVVYNLLNAASELASKTGVDDSDAVSFGFWRFAWLALVAVGIAVLMSMAMGKLPDYLTLLVKSVSAIPFITIVMIVVFFGNAWANRGLALSNATIKNIAMTTQGVMSVFATAIVALVLPGIFVTAPATPAQWLLRLIGASLLMWGILRLVREDVN